MNMLIGSYGDKTEKIRAAGGCNVNDSEIKGRVSFIHDHRLEGGPKKSSRCSAVVVVVERRGRVVWGRLRATENPTNIFTRWRRVTQHSKDATTKKESGIV